LKFEGYVDNYIFIVYLMKGFMAPSARKKTCLSLKGYASPTKNKTHKCHNSGVTTCIFLFFQCLHVHTRVCKWGFTYVSTVVYVVNCHNTCENTFLLIKLYVNMLPYFWLGQVVWGAQTGVAVAKWYKAQDWEQRLKVVGLIIGHAVNF